MKKIAISLGLIGIVAAVAVIGTVAYFSDTETNQGNTFTTGTINIDIAENEEWSQGFQLIDMKPSQTDYIEFKVKNTGTNPVNIWKKLINLEPSDNGEPNEPECLAGGGFWDGEFCESYQAKYNLQSYIIYDLAVEVYEDENAQDPLWWQVIYRDEDGKTITGVYNGSGANGILLGMIPAGGYMKISQSYHLLSTVGNWAQNDSLTFGIKIVGEQLTGTVILDNKVDANGAPGDVYLTPDDGVGATLTYKVKDKKFKFNFSAQGITDTNYVLVAGKNPWNGPDTVALGTYTATGGVINVTDQIIDINQDLINAKVWLILASDWSVDHMTGWHGGSYLFETSLIDYYDADL